MKITQSSSAVLDVDPSLIDFGPDVTWEEHQQANGIGSAPTVAKPKLTYFDDCGVFISKRWIMKGVIARGETSGWTAPPGHGKSALLTEIAVHCAARIDWRGYKAKEPCGVVYLALERADLCKRRLRAYAMRDKLKGLPIAVHDGIIDLLTPACVAAIVEIVREAKQHFGCDVGLIIIDTFNKASRPVAAMRTRRAIRTGSRPTCARCRSNSTYTLRLWATPARTRHAARAAATPIWVTSTSWFRSAATSLRPPVSPRATTSPSGWWRGFGLSPSGLVSMTTARR